MAAASQSNAPSLSIEARYQQLPCSEMDKIRIHTVIEQTAKFLSSLDKLADWAKAYFGKLGRAKRAAIEAIGDEIEAHPLKFIATIFSNPDIYKHMPMILEKGLAWTQFMSSLESSLREKRVKEKNRDLSIYAEPFAKSLGIDVEKTRTWMQNLQWATLMEHLIEVKCSKR